MMLLLKPTGIHCIICSEKIIFFKPSEQSSHDQVRSVPCVVIAGTLWFIRSIFNIWYLPNSPRKIVQRQWGILMQRNDCCFLAWKGTKQMKCKSIYLGLVKYLDSLKNWFRLICKINNDNSWICTCTWHGIMHQKLPIFILVF